MAMPAAPERPCFAEPELEAAWQALDCGFAEVAEVFASCAPPAIESFSPQALSRYLATARQLGKLGRGAAPLLAFLESWPALCETFAPLDPRDDGVQATVHATLLGAVEAMQRSPNGEAIAPFLQTLPAVARRLQTPELLADYAALVLDLMARTSGSIHGRQATVASPGLPGLLQQAPRLLELLSLAGLKAWTEYGIRNYRDDPDRQRDYFGLKSPDSQAVLQRERHGTLLVDVERQLGLVLRALWGDEAVLLPFATTAATASAGAAVPALPHCGAHGIYLPDVLDTLAAVGGGSVGALDRYRARLAHLAGHRRYSTAQIADNWSPLQRLAVETFEDARIDRLLIAEYPGLGKLLLALHPAPAADACDPATTSCLRHRLTRLSRALLDPASRDDDPVAAEFIARFDALLADGPANTRDIAALALSWAARTRRQSDQFAEVHFTDTTVDYRDDNRVLWRFIEAGDEEESFDQPKPQEPPAEPGHLPPRHYPEWDAGSQTYRPDWVSLYENLHPAGDPAKIDRLLAKHHALAGRLRRVLDLLKPQERVRLRFQEDGSELDLDVALRSLIELRSGVTPDPRINLSHRTDGRNIAVLILLDLSESLNEKVAGAADDQTVLELSQEAVSLLAWAIDYLGDACAIAGFRSNTRHEVRYFHLKGFSEGFDDTVKARLAAMDAGWSTRMGAALRHAAHYLEHRQADKKLLLVLTDGQPADVDVRDPRQLIDDARQAVRELDRKGIFSYCISLDRAADDYVSDIFAQRFSVIDNIQRLPERLPELFVALTR